MKKLNMNLLIGILSYLLSFFPLEAGFRFLTKRAGNAENHIYWLNGERLSMSKISPHGVVYDIGANHGQWSKELMAIRPGVDLYPFEMIPEFAARAERALKRRVFNVGLSDRTDRMTAFQYGGGAALTKSLVNKKPRKDVPVSVVRGDDFVRDNNIPLPTFIKIDTDGHEMKVLRGLEETIKAARPIVQFEYSPFSINERVFLVDFFTFFGGMGYKIYRIEPRHLVEKNYTPNMENFWTTNYLAYPA